MLPENIDANMMAWARDDLAECASQGVFMMEMKKTSENMIHLFLVFTNTKGVIIWRSVG